MICKKLSVTPATIGAAIGKIRSTIIKGTNKIPVVTASSKPYKPTITSK